MSDAGVAYFRTSRSRRSVVRPVSCHFTPQQGCANRMRDWRNSPPLRPKNGRSWRREGILGDSCLRKKPQGACLYFIFFVTLKFLIYSLNKVNNCYNAAIIFDLLVLRNMWFCIAKYILDLRRQSLMKQTYFSPIYFIKEKIKYF